MIYIASVWQVYMYVLVPLQEIPICFEPPSFTDPKQEAAGARVHAAGAYIAKTKTWLGRQTLSVYFMNEDFIEQHGWRCGLSSMTVDTIMAWANVWNSPGYEKIPRLVRTDLSTQTRRADIRVQFSGEL